MYKVTFTNFPNRDVVVWAQSPSIVRTQASSSLRSSSLLFQGALVIDSSHLSSLPGSPSADGPGPLSGGSMQPGTGPLPQAGMTPRAMPAAESPRTFAAAALKLPLCPAWQPLLPQVLLLRALSTKSECFPGKLT